MIWRLSGCGWLVMALWLSGCSEKPPSEVSAAFLLLHSETYQGRQVILEGWVRGMQDPEHYWLEDDQQRRIALHPAQTAQPFLDQPVRVTGRFNADLQRGRRLSEIQIDPVSP